MNWHWYDWVIWFGGLAAWWYGGVRHSRRSERARCAVLVILSTYDRYAHIRPQDLIYAIENGATELPSERHR